MSNSENCPICSSRNIKNLGEKNSFFVIKCKNCLTIFSADTNKDRIHFDYSNYYKEENVNTPDFIYDVYRNVIRGFEPYRSNNRFLDVGSGAGALLDVAREFGWNAVGVEISVSAAEYTRKRGFDIYEGVLEAANFPDDNFDVITCTEVVEHVEKPKELINEISRILSPDGVLWITTPNSRALSERLLGKKWNVITPPEHIALFSIKSLKMCLEEAGFKKFRFASSGINPFEILRDFKSNPTIETAPQPQAPEYVKSCEINKWFQSGQGKRKIKNFLNFILSSMNLGDTIKVRATFK